MSLKPLSRYALFLDDVRQVFHEEGFELLCKDRELPIITIRDFENFVQCIETHGIPSAVSLDFDLGWSGKNGLHALEFLLNMVVQEVTPLPDIYFHSGSFLSRTAMENYLKDFIEHS